MSLILSAPPAVPGTDNPAAPEVQHHLPRMSSIFPQGWERGVTVHVEVLGEYLDRTQTVDFEDVAMHGRVLESHHSQAELEIEIPRDASFGFHYFRIVSPRGASNLLPFRIGDQPHRLEKEPNSTFEQAEEVPLPMTINGRLNTPGDFDFFRFHAEKGAAWIFDLRAGRNANPLDAGLILLDRSRRQLAHSEDFFYFDPFLIYTFDETGDYTVVVQPSDDQYLNPNFAYQLDIRQAPYLQTVAPLSLLPGKETEATVFGLGLFGDSAQAVFEERGFEGQVVEMQRTSARVKIRVPAEDGRGEHRFVLVTRGGRSNFVTFLVDSTPLYSGEDLLKPPVQVNGIAHYPQPERFSFEARANESLVFEIRARRFGSPVDSFLRVVDAKGKEVAKNDDGDMPGITFNKDSLITHTFKEAGTYELQIRNLWAVDGPNYPYQLLMRPLAPAADLMLDSDNPFVYKDGKGSLKVSAVRSGGFDGPIRLAVKGLPTGVAAEPAEIPAGAKEGTISFRARGVPAGTFARIEVVSDEFGAAWKSLPLPRDGGDESTLTRVESATLVVAEKPHFSLEAGVTHVTLTPGRSAEIPIQIQRDKGFDGEIRFAFENLPAGVSFVPAVAAKGSNLAQIRVSAAGEAQPVRAGRVMIVGTADQGDTNCAPPFTVSIE